MLKFNPPLNSLYPLQIKKVSMTLTTPPNTCFFQRLASHNNLFSCALYLESYNWLEINIQNYLDRIYFLNAPSKLGLLNPIPKYLIMMKFSCPNRLENYKTT